MARTKYAAQGADGGAPIQGDFSKAITGTCTNDATTTLQLNKKGFAMGHISNATASSIAITWYSVDSDDGTAYALYDSEGNAVTQTVGATNNADLHPACASAPYLVPVIGAATGVLTFVFSR